MFEGIKSIFIKPEVKPVVKTNMGGSKWSDQEVTIIEQLYLHHRNGQPLSEEMQKVVNSSQQLKETWNEYVKRISEEKARGK